MERNIWEIPTRDINSGPVLNNYMPDQNIDNPDPKLEENKMWYLNNLYYISQFYNLPTDNVVIPAATSFDKFLQNELGPVWGLPANRMYLYMKYAGGEQANLMYNHLVQNIDGKHDAIVKWTRGRNVQGIINKMRGFGLGELTEIKMGADPLSPDAKGRVEEWAEKEMLKVLLRPVVENALKDFLKPQDPAEQKFDSLEAVKKFKEEKYKDHLADTYLDIAKDLWFKGRWVEQGLKMLKYGLVCGACGLEWVLENGYLKPYIHEPWLCIFDTNHDDDFSYQSRFGGVLPQMTLTQIFKRYPQLTSEQREWLNKTAQDSTIQNTLNLTNKNFTWWGGTNVKTNFYHDFTCTVLRAYWIGTEKIDGEIVETVYTGTIIGNKYMVDFGPAENIVENPNEPYTVQTPFIQWTPNMALGIFDSMVARIHGLQDKMDFCQFRAEELLAKAMGRVPSIDLSQIDGVDDVYKLLERIRTTGIIGRTRSNMADNPADHSNLVEMVDMSLNNDIDTFLKYRAALEAEMQSFTGQPSMGQMTKYVGQKAYAGNMEQTEAQTAAFWASWMTGIQIALRYGLNVKKNLYAAGFLKEEALTVVGKKGLKMLQDTKDMYCEDFGIYLMLNDRPSEEFRQRMLEFLKAYVSQPGQGGITPGDYLDFEFTATKSAIKDKWKAKEAEIEERRNKMEMERMKAQAEENDKARAHEQQGWMLDAATSKYKVDRNAEAKLEVADKKNGAATEAANPTLPIQENSAPAPQPAPTAPAQSQQ